MDAELIGVLNSQTKTSGANNNHPNRMSVIPAAQMVASFTAAQSQTSGATSASKSRTVTSKTGPSKAAQQIRMSGNRSKAGSGAS